MSDEYKYQLYIYGRDTDTLDPLRHSGYLLVKYKKDEDGNYIAHEIQDLSLGGGDKPFVVAADVNFSIDTTKVTYDANNSFDAYNPIQDLDTSKNYSLTELGVNDPYDVYKKMKLDMAIRSYDPDEDEMHYSVIDFACNTWTDYIAKNLLGINDVFSQLNSSSGGEYTYNTGPLDSLVALWPTEDAYKQRSLENFYDWLNDPNNSLLIPDFDFAPEISPPQIERPDPNIDPEGAERWDRAMNSYLNNWESHLKWNDDHSVEITLDGRKYEFYQDSRIWTDDVENGEDGKTIFLGGGADGMANTGDDVDIHGGEGRDTVRNWGDGVNIDGGDDWDTIINYGDGVTIDGGSGADSIYDDGDGGTIVDLGRDGYRDYVDTTLIFKDAYGSDKAV